MEAFSHFSYHALSGKEMVCNLQGRFRRDSGRRRFEFTDPAICSCTRSYGPTDLGEKGIDNFFHNHCCNEFCDKDWKKPSHPHQWFPVSEKTSMLSSSVSSQLRLNSARIFQMGFNNVLKERK